MNTNHPIAVIGLGALFPGAANVRQYWHNIASGHDAIAEASPDRFDRRFLDPDARAVDRLPTVRGGFVPDTLPFDAGAFGIMPISVQGGEPDQLFALSVAANALDDAGYLASDRLDRSRTGVILGRGGYITPGLVRLGRKAREAEQLIGLLRDLLPGVDEADLQRVKTAFSEASGVYGPDTAIGLVPNLAASRIANRLDLGGPAYTLDAACASALIAVEHAARELRSGRCDLVLAGGVHLTHDLSFWSVFTQIGALSASGAIRPFDAAADGLLIGEGIGVLALKRLDRAMADDDRIYAVLHGVGSASDGRASTVMTPRVEGQVLAMQRAWADAGLDPSTIGLVEAHGTGTPVGDAAEATTLGRFFGLADPDGPRVALGSVKSMIGHTMPAAGAAGLIKAVLSVYHGVLPPTLHCEAPRAELDPTRFAPLGEARPWEDTTRVAAVNAFGFGGINAHVVLTGHGAAVPTRRRSHAPQDRRDASILAVAAADPEALIAAIDQGRTRGGEGPCRLALADPSPDRLARARRIVERGKPWTGRGGIWYRPEGLLGRGGRIAFVYPGIEASFHPEVRTVAQHFDLPAPTVYPGRADLEHVGVGVVNLGGFLTEVMTRIGITPDVMIGHSIGEWTAMQAAGILSKKDLSPFLDGMRFGTLEVPGVLFAAAGCGVDIAHEVIADLQDIAVSHDNCPHQVILCGHDDPVNVARQRLLDRGVLCQILPFRSGFHSPLLAEHLGMHIDNFSRMTMQPAQIPMFSATTTGPFPSDPEAIRALTLDHLVKPLRFRELIVALYERGARVFLQIGQGSVTGFVQDTLSGADHLTIALSDERRTGLAQIRNVLLALFVEGAPVDPWRALTGTDTRVLVSLATPLIRLPGMALATAEPPAPTPTDPLHAALAQATAALSRGPSDVVAALRRRQAPTVWTQTRRLSVDDVPELIGHCFYAQPDTPDVVLSDLYPVVPMTMTLAVLCEACEAARPGQVVVEVRDLRATRWLMVEPPLEVEIRVEARPDGWMHAEVTGYASARMRLAANYPEAPDPALPPLAEPRPTPVDPPTLYADRWMFHGPEYQGVSGLFDIDATGLNGEIQVLDSPGALMDAAGQLVGYWLMATQVQDQLTLPTGVGRIEWFAPPPPTGDRVGCQLRIDALTPTDVIARAEMTVADRVWCRIADWVDHRFTADSNLFVVMRLPEHNLLCPVEDGVAFFDESAHRLPPRDWLVRRYLAAAERTAMLEAGPRRQRRFLDDRIAAKDVLRALLWSEGPKTPWFPISFPLIDTPTGGLAVQGHDDLFVAVDHLDRVSVAVAARHPVGIALARHGEVTPAELCRRAAGAAPDADVVRSDEPFARVGTQWVRWAQRGTHLVAWTVHGPPAR